MSNARHTLSQIRKTVAEMNYAQRRVVELKMVIPAEELRYSSGEREEIEELEALYGLEPAIAQSENPS